MAAYEQPSPLLNLPNEIWTLISVFVEPIYLLPIAVARNGIYVGKRFGKRGYWTPLAKQFLALRDTTAYETEIIQLFSLYPKRIRLLKEYYTRNKNYWSWPVFSFLVSKMKTISLAYFEYHNEDLITIENIQKLEESGKQFIQVIDFHRTLIKHLQTDSLDLTVLSYLINREWFRAYIFKNLFDETYELRPSTDGGGWETVVKKGKKAVERIVLVNDDLCSIMDLCPTTKPKRKKK